MMTTKPSQAKPSQAKPSQAKPSQVASASENSAAPDQQVGEVPGASPNFRTELAAQLAKLVPEAVADGKLDVEKLRELLADDVADSNERFGLFWPGKKRALRAAQAPTTATLKPDFARSKNWDTTQNVFIEGDNLEGGCRQSAFQIAPHLFN